MPHVIAILKGLVEGLIFLAALAVMAAALWLLTPEARAAGQPLHVRFTCLPEPTAKARLQREGYTPAGHWTDSDGDAWFLVARPDGKAVFGVMVRNADTGAMDFCALPAAVSTEVRS